ncbi:MAG: DUF5106 domain-containing protein [Chitinophagales bacterium]|nr:DUF5106 domain-containing protein [Bacteroidota bacterium]MCB9255955.1 DUF5106 domain-containing protein [Chitinophagales bacterium]
MKRTVIIGIFSLLSGILFAQKSGHKITLTAPQLANETMWLAYHMGNKQYISDTLQFDAKGKLIIQGDEAKPTGIYLAVFPKFKNNYFEFLIKEQFFDITLADTTKLKSPTFSKSIENDAFYKDLEVMTKFRSKTQPLEEKYKNANGENKEALKLQIESLSKEFTDYRKSFMENNKALFYADILGLMREIELPDAPEGSSEKEDQQFKYDYFMDHYWQYTDFTEEGILRTPIFDKKLKEYFEKYVQKNTDSIIVECDKVLKLAEANDKVYQSCLITLINKYANSKVMGEDAVYVHLVKNYYEAGKAEWVDSTQLAKMKERRIALEPLLIGKLSPDLTLRDTSINTLYKLHDLPFDYTIVYIWDPECGHCKKATPKLKTFFDAHKSESMMVYAITTSNIEELQIWKDFIKKHDLNWVNVADLYHQTKFRTYYDVNSTPQVFILDKDKKIIAKKIGVEQLENFFHQYLKSIGDDRYKNFTFDESINMENEGEHSEENH